MSMRQSLFLTKTQQGWTGTCLVHEGFDVSFENIHKNHKKCTPKQIMLYQIAINLHKVINDIDNLLTFEYVTLLDQMVCTQRQLRFEMIWNFNVKIGMNTTANKFYHINKLISLDMLNLKFVHFKKLAKFQFLKYGQTWSLTKLLTRT